MDERRAQRVSEAMREELSEIIGYEMSDPRLSLVDVTEVHLSPDLRRAQVRVALGGTEAEQQEALQTLEKARGYLRRAISQRLQLYRTPDLHFEPAAKLRPGTRVDQLLKRIRRGRPRDNSSAHSPEPEKSPGNET
ncbi:MAG: 30S ribosome-binding factor RbfA [Bryobacteraceae bacterium]|nr:30S ribosome-binding factor RbfA [Bryobacteraceae bacterium]